jgi:hypothetical protein
MSNRKGGLSVPDWTVNLADALCLAAAQAGWNSGGYSRCYQPGGPEAFLFESTVVLLATIAGTIGFAKLTDHLRRRTNRNSDCEAPPDAAKMGYSRHLLLGLALIFVGYGAGHISVSRIADIKWLTAIAVVSLVTLLSGTLPPVQSSKKERLQDT